MNPTTEGAAHRAPRSVDLNDPFAGGGEMGDLMRAYPWESTPLGPVSTWPQTLLTSLSLCLRTKIPMVMGWGPEITTFYNDAYAPILAGKHPWALGRPIAEVWSDIWVHLKGMVDEAWSSGVATPTHDMPFFMFRKGYLEECYMSGCLSAITIEGGEVGGLMSIVFETTDRVLGQRRLRTLRELVRAAADLSDRSDAKGVDRSCEEACRVLGTNVADVPFSLIYLVDADGKHARLAGASGIEVGHTASPKVIALDDAHAPWPLQRVAQTKAEAVAADLSIRLEDPTVLDVVSSALVLPLVRAGQSRLYGFLVAGVSPTRRDFDENYRAFFHLIGEQVTSAISNASAYEEERNRAEALADIDRAKTTFFSNVSHELRTPLTLILGPVEDALAESARSLHDEGLETVHRNALRLLRLVNSLLDFARLAAGGPHLTFVQTDLSALTRDLASTFRSLIERAGLKLVVDCPPIAEPLYVDPSKWEKIVLNLLSNAFKFTFEGEITVRLRSCGDHVELTVTDTGAGISTRELSHIFERFHTVEGAKGRSIEGTGIGLSLVQELVRAHGGSVRVSSVEGQGSTFEVSLPTGRAHLPAERIAESAAMGAVTAEGAAAPYVLEASQWIGSVQELDVLPLARSEAVPREARARVIVADDNADMRDYLTRLLSTLWQVEAVEDGVAALASARRQPPDLVLSDVMMPRMDGVALLGALRALPETRHVPVVLLSARAGEEAILKGLETGADDYLIKPFAARELIARVQTHLDLSRHRRAWADELARANEREHQLEIAVQARDEFIAIASHELKTPLTPLALQLAMARKLLRECHDSGAAVPAEQLAAKLESAAQSLERMTGLINKLLDVGRVTSDHLTLARERMDLRDAVTRAADGLHAALRASGASLVTTADKPAVGFWDPQGIQTIATNLLSNAINYGAGKPIAIRIESDSDVARLTVTDHGIGIPGDAKARIFERFERAVSAHHYGGFGVGLWLVRRIVEAHGGTIRVDSTTGEGATFTVELPLALRA
jgi:signal transduction histidine kinase